MLRLRTFGHCRNHSSRLSAAGDPAKLAIWTLQKSDSRTSTPEHQRLARKEEGHNQRMYGSRLRRGNISCQRSMTLAGSWTAATRDLASMHGTWHSVAQTEPALDLCCAALAEVRPSTCLWRFDRPVSNSGRISVMIAEAARVRGLAWEVVVEDQVDSALCSGPAVAITADAGILDRTPAWCCAATAIVDGFIPQAWVLDLTA